MRKLASIRRIADIQPIDGADAIDVATVDGWKVVVKKGEFAVGDLAVYLEIDSWVPYELAPFLVKNGAIPREYNGVKGERLRTIKLRGQISQGLLLSIVDYVDDVPFITGWYHEDGIGTMIVVDEGKDVADALGVQKWEVPIPSQMQGQAKGTFPTLLIRKTDQERIQNCFNKVLRGDYTYEVSMKLDGSSMTLFRYEGELRVCSRNMELKIDEENKDIPFIKMAMKYGDQVPEGFAFQGELMGPGVQGNREGFAEHRFFVFDVFLIDEYTYAGPAYRRALCKERGFEHVPVLQHAAKAPESVDAGLAFAEGPSINHKIREGLVWKCNEAPDVSFKVISNTFLLKSGD